MKSLDMVNKYINAEQTVEVKGNDKLPSIFVDDIRIAGVKWNDSPNINYMSAKINTHSRVISMGNLKQIKQDLEVLEIIRKSHLGDDDIFIRFLIASYMDIDEYNKVKQWLDERE